MRDDIDVFKKQLEQRIRTAFKRIATGDFDYCIHCEEGIAEGRLRADPSALTCIACARSVESRLLELDAAVGKLRDDCATKTVQKPTQTHLMMQRFQQYTVFIA